MKNQLIKFATLALLSAGVFSCKKDYGVGLGPLQDAQAETPVTVTNATFFERYPVVTTSVAGGGRFTINFEIPAGKGVIREITRVVTGPSVIANFGNLNLASAGTALNTTGDGTVAMPFALAPIRGNGTNQISFSGVIGTTPSVYSYLPYRIRNGAGFGPAGPQAGTPPAGPVTAPVPSTTAIPTDIQFYFRFTLEDGSTIVSMPVRVRVTP